MTEEQFGTMSTRKIFFKLALPGLFGMLFASIGMMIDGLFVGRFIGSDALAAINLVMPIVMIVFALADMIAAGASVRVAIYLGEKQEEKARNLFTSSLLIILFLSLLFMVLWGLVGEQVIYSLINEKELAIQAVKYTQGFIIFLPFIMPMFAIDNFLRNCGKVNYSMYVGLGVSILNIILDIILIGYFRLDIFYAALATAISMSLGTLFSLIPFISKRVTLYFVKPSIDTKELIGIMYNGSSDFFNNISGSLMSFVINVLLLHFGGGVAVASYSIVMYINGMLISVLYGIQDAIKPAISYNLGAKQIDRTFELFNICAKASFIISIGVMIIVFIFPETLISVFATENDIEVKTMAKTALFLYAPSYLFTWYNMICSSFLTSFDKPKESIIIMIASSVVFPLISLIIVPQIIGLNGIYLTPFVASVFTLFVTISIWTKVVKQFKTNETNL